eukprot:CAMPEP_0198516402 /NCGR_PEP_ID=MMETSP1462-20131121/17894_1 /TAXON_ID=1333877 /ORGANISM="Brandtodinium nutriculum, Strain RCC3387" /LENGTH=105 /DNA_ID=CAMNT_0044245929 /DNA_START=27 /DNA_END=341 /DNA_ORIENTATION=-
MAHTRAASTTPSKGRTKSGSRRWTPKKTTTACNGQKRIHLARIWRKTNIGEAGGCSTPACSAGNAVRKPLIKKKTSTAGRPPLSQKIRKGLSFDASVNHCSSALT